MRIDCWRRTRPRARSSVLSIRRQSNVEGYRREGDHERSAHSLKSNHNIQQDTGEPEQFLQYTLTIAPHATAPSHLFDVPQKTRLLQASH